MSSGELRCPPYTPNQPPVPMSIAQRAALVMSIANRYRDSIDNRESFDVTMRTGRQLAAESTELASAIADAIASGNGDLTEFVS